MSKKNIPAFPLFRTFPGDDNDMVTLVQPGMTLRDWFAGQALATLISLHENRDGGWCESEVATSAYDMADAMLAARSAAKGE
jgi:hypothetical protein